MAGRPSKLSLPRLKMLIQIIGGGNYVSVACDFAGIGTSTFDGWRERGDMEMDRVRNLARVDYDALMDPYLEAPRNGVDHMWENPPRHFSKTEWPYVVATLHTRQAQSAAEMRALGVITAAFGDDWHAAAWFLERTKPERYTRRDKVSLEGATPGSAPKISLTVDDLEQQLRDLIDDDRK